MSRLKSIMWLIPHWKFLLSIAEDEKQKQYIREQIKKIEDFEKKESECNDE